MKRTLVWLLFSLMLWGVPAFFFWIGMGVGSNLLIEQGIRKAQESIHASIETASEKIAPEVFLQEFLKSRSQSLLESPLRSSESRTAREELIRPFPHGAIRVFLFDHRGILFSPEGLPKPDQMQALFDFIRAPLTTDLRDPAEVLPEEASFSKQFRALGLNLKARGAGALVTDARATWAPLSDPDWAYFDWREGQRPGLPGGLVVLISEHALPPDFFMKAVLSSSASSSAPGLPSLGYWLDSMNFGPPPGIPDAVYRRLIDTYLHAPSPHFLVDGYAAEGCFVGNDAVILAVMPLPRASPFIYILIFIFYAVFSFRFLVFLHRFFVQGRSPRMSLERKLAFLFLLGFVFPLVVSVGIGALYLREKDAGLLDEHRRESLSSLDVIDAEFERYLATLQLEYRRVTGEYSRGERTLESITRYLAERFQSSQITDYALIASSGDVVSFNLQPVVPEFTRIFLLPRDERLEYLKHFWKGGNHLTFSRINSIVQGQRIASLSDAVELPPYRYSPERFENIRKGLSAIGRDVLDEVNSRMDGGSRPAKTAIPIADLMSDVMVEFLARMKTHLGSVFELSNSDYTVYHFADILRGEGGRGEYLIWASHTAANLQQEFLERYFATVAQGKNRPPFSAVGLPNLMVRTFPNLTDLERLLPLQRQVTRSGAAAGSFRKTIDGIEQEISFRRGRCLGYFILFHITPVSDLQTRAHGVFLRVIAFITGSCLFGLILAWLFIQSFLVPLESLSHGIEAIQHKKYDHRIPLSAKDELGQLCSEFNRAMEHMHEMEAASVIQKNLYPEGDLNVGRFFIHGRNEMNQAIGGDYYDYIPLPDGRVAFAIGDVSGHGVSAALVTAMAKAGFLLLLPKHIDNPIRVLEKVGDVFMAILQRKKMMTCLLGLLNPVSGQVLLFNAGQCSPYIFERDGSGQYLELPSTPLGISKRTKFVSRELNLDTQTVVFITDGLVELKSADGTFLGYETFEEIIRKAYADASIISPDIIFNEIRRFTGDVPWPDDATAMVLALRPAQQGSARSRSAP